MNMPRADRCVVVLMLVALLVGCASSKVKCDGRLEPINTPAPKAATLPKTDTPPQSIESQP
jgi:hypothetical protein